MKTILNFTFFFLINFNFLACESNAVHKYTQAIDQLGSENHFTFVNLEISQKDLEILENLQVNFTGSLEQYGDIEQLIDKIPEFLNKIGNEDEIAVNRTTDIIYKIINDVITASNKDSAWISIRAFVPTHEYDIARWHTDGYFYPPYKGKEYKFAFVIKGPSTLFYKLPGKMREKFYEVYGNGNNREAVLKILDPSKTITLDKGVGGFFLVGDHKTSAVHSEPKIDVKRIFISVVPGSIEQVKKREKFVIENRSKKSPIQNES